MSVEEILQIMRELIAETLATDPAKITMETSFEDDLDANSVDLVEVAMGMEERFDIGEVSEEELAGLKTVGDAVRFLAARLK